MQAGEAQGCVGCWVLLEVLGAGGGVGHQWPCRGLVPHTHHGGRVRGIAVPPK